MPEHMVGDKLRETSHQNPQTPTTAKSPERPEPTLRSDTLAAGDVAIVVKAESGEEFKITSPAAQLEQIGELLRGKRKAWGIRTLVISISASTATLVLSGAIAAGFQYVSWANSVILSNATDRVAKAHDTFNEAMTTIGARWMATRDFVPTLQELVNNQSTADSNLAKLSFDLERTRMADYYDKLKQWNVGYNGLLAKIEYDLDRQIYRATQTNAGDPVSNKRTTQVDCSKTITEEMRKVGYEQHSLKAQFAIIHYCFGLISATIDSLRNKALSDKSVKIDDTASAALDDSLGHVNTTANIFQCYAKQRQEFYIDQIAASITNPLALLQRSVYEHTYGPAYMRNYVQQRRKPAVLDHFKTADMRCDPTYAQS
jgi:hypothetical protein